jgi:serine/threonine protein phosphatase 1
MSRTIVIGDIHGCLKALDAVLRAIALQPDDLLITIGDYVDRGPDSKGVIERLIRLQDEVKLVPILGNHEEMMLSALDRQTSPYSWFMHGGAMTMESYGFVGDISVIPPKHFDFLRSLKPYFETDTHFFVHANYDPKLALAEQPSHLLRWVKLSERMPGPHLSDKIAIVGHTHEPEGRIVRLPHLICIDTYCYGGRWLTAMDVQSEEIWQANSEGELIALP